VRVCARLCSRSALRLGCALRPSLAPQAIWISPIPKNTPGGYHGYWFEDLYQLNPHFGAGADLRRLVDACHDRNIAVMLDIVSAARRSRHIARTQARTHARRGNAARSLVCSPSTARPACVQVINHAGTFTGNPFNQACAPRTPARPPARPPHCVPAWAR
jgi:hypothetical protein